VQLRNEALDVIGVLEPFPVQKLLIVDVAHEAVQPVAMPWQPFLWGRSAGHLRADLFEEVYPGKPNHVLDRGLTGLLQLG